MQNKNINLIILYLIIAFTLMFSVESQAGEMTADEQVMQQSISNLEKQTQATKSAINALQNQKEAAEDVVDSLKDQSRELKNTVSDYNNQLDDISSEIAQTEESMAEVSSQIVELDNELSEAEESEAKQYEALKAQIRSSYMSRGRNGLLSMIYESGNSFRRMLNVTRYVESVVGYNHKKLVELQEIQEKIKQKKSKVEERQEEIDAYQEKLDDKYSELSDLTDKVMSDLDATNASLSTAKNRIADFDAQIVKLDAMMKSLEAQTAAAQAALAKQIAARLAASAQKEYTGGSYAASASELQWLAATIQAEADGESYTGKLAVGSVIMNRVKSSSFPNSIVGVITQNMQFASYRSGKVNLIINNGPNSTCVQAAEEVLGGARVGDYLFFMTKPYADKYGIKNYTMIGNHAFFYSWYTGGSVPAPQAPAGTENNAGEDTQSQETPEVIEEIGESNPEESEAAPPETPPAEDNQSENSAEGENTNED